MYADTMTGSMQRAIDETYRRRRIQIEYNERNGIQPQGIQKAIRDISNRVRAVAEQAAEYTTDGPVTMPKDEIARLIQDLEVQMRQAAKNLNFEEAAAIRDQVATQCDRP
jgi:excinuclease ABC subunit B